MMNVAASNSLLCLFLMDDDMAWVSTDSARATLSPTTPSRARLALKPKGSALAEVVMPGPFDHLAVGLRHLHALAAFL